MAFAADTTAQADRRRIGVEPVRAAVRFSEARGRARTTRRASANAPGAAEVYAQVIVDYWDAALAGGDLDPDKALYVLELQAREGRQTYLLIRALLAKLGRRGLRFRYVAADTTVENLDFIDAHPYLQPYVAAGCLETAFWDPEAGDWFLRRHDRRFVSMENPLVVVADRVYADLAHDLFGFHYGHMYEGRIADAADHSPAAFEWTPIEHADWLPSRWAPLLAEYRERLDSTSMLLPSGAMRCIDRLHQISAGRYLLLAVDEAVGTEEELRAMCGMDAATDAAAILPVNYHALACYQARQGARVWSGRAGESAAVPYVALGARPGAVYDDYFSTAIGRVAQLGPDDYCGLGETARAAAEHLSPEQLLKLVRLSGHDPRVLGGVLDPLLPKLATLGREGRLCWRDALERTWSNYFPVLDGDPFHFNAGLLAGQLEHWGLAKEAFRLGVAMYGEEPATLRCLGYCEAASGGAVHGLECLSRAIALDPRDNAAQELQAQLNERVRRWNGLSWYRADIARDDDLVLEPLGGEHAESLWYQYRDPQIGVMTRLPELTTLEQTIEWIGTQEREAGRAVYAVVHASWGLVGVVSFRRHTDAAYFYFWIGADYQNRGFGRRAGALLFRQAEAQGVCALYTSAYPDNVRSRRALAGLGFTPIEIAAAAPDDDLLFFSRALGGDVARSRRAGAAAQRLRALCAGIDSPLVFPAEPVKAGVDHE
ncbi:MAG: GNAT family N-acetyltransferase [Sulfurifustaceae bacterium]